jgi:magnesium-transporting ATPase (P-type)
MGSVAESERRRRTGMHNNQGKLLLFPSPKIVLFVCLCFFTKVLLLVCFVFGCFMYENTYSNLTTWLFYLFFQYQCGCMLVILFFFFKEKLKTQNL